MPRLDVLKRIKDNVLIDERIQILRLAMMAKFHKNLVNKAEINGAHLHDTLTSSEPESCTHALVNIKR